MSFSWAYFSFLISFSGMLEDRFSFNIDFALVLSLSGKGNALIVGNCNTAIKNKQPDKKCIAPIHAAVKNIVGKNVAQFPLVLGSK